MPKFKPVKTVKSLANLADKWWLLRADRLALEKQAEAVAVTEREAKAALMESFKLIKDATSVGGKLVVVSIDEEDVPTVTDWPKLYAHIKKTGAWELLQRRVAVPAVRERWEEDKAIPGVDSYPLDKLKYSKVK